MRRVSRRRADEAPAPTQIQLRSVANMTRQDARDFLSLAADIGLRPKVTIFSLDQANEALMAVKNDAVDGAAVLVP